LEDFEALEINYMVSEIPTPHTNKNLADDFTSDALL